LLELLNPRDQARSLVLVLVFGLLGWGLLVWSAGMPIWGATSLVLAALLVPGVRKWRADLHRDGLTVMILSVLLTLQGFHSLEHLVQWVQYHILHWQPQRSSGLISAANAEWVHFVWNYGVVFVVALLMTRGMRGPWAWLLLAWSVAHTVEHTYMMVRYLQVKRELGLLGEPAVSAQGLPGILGRDGWLATSALTADSWCGRLPGVTTAPRLDIHFWWNAGEAVLLAAAAHAYLRIRRRPEPATRGAHEQGPYL
jgi:hypothetical protein